MAQFVNIFDVDLQRPASPQPLRQIIGEGNALGNRIGARVTDGGEVITLGGTCVGKVVRADGATVELTGTIDGNLAYVDLDQASCAVEGQIQVAVCWVSGSNVTTLAIGYGTVVNTETGTAIQPSDPIPDLAQLLAAIDDMQDATAAAEAAADEVLGNFAGAFDATQAYRKGAYVTYTDGKLCRLTADHAANVTWANTSKHEVTVAERLALAVYGYGSLVNNATNLANITGNTNSVDDFPLNTVVNVSYTISGLTNAPNIANGIGTYLTLCDSYGVDRCITQIFIARGGQIVTRHKHNADSGWSSWRYGLYGWGKMIANASDLNAMTVNTNSCNDFPMNSVQMIGAINIGLTDYPPIGNGMGTYLTIGYGVHGTDAYTGKTQIYIDRYGRMAHREYFNAASGWSAWIADNEIAKVNFTFTSSTTVITSAYYMTAGKTYYLKTNIPSTVLDTNRFNAFIESHSDEFVRVFDSWVSYTPSNSGYLRVGSMSGYEGDMVMTVMPDTQEYRAIYNTAAEYAVDVTGAHSSYTSLTDLILSFVKGYDSSAEDDSTALWQDETPKIIKVYPGEYDIFAEYLAEIASDNPRLHAMADIPSDIPANKWFGGYNAVLPPNTTLIGLGDVTLKFTPTTSQIGVGASLTWSPLNVKAGCRIENITIVCKNGRYGIHDDPGSGKYGNTEHIYENVTVKYIEDSASYGRLNTIGFGFAQNSKYLFKNCRFEYDGSGAHGIFYGHDSGTGQALIVLENCIVKSSNVGETKGIRLQTIQSTSSSPGHNTFKALNSALQGGLNYSLYSDTALQAFETLFLHSGDPGVTTSKPAGNTTTNPYPPEIIPAATVANNELII